jgi:hypothetical protein
MVLSRIAECVFPGHIGRAARWVPWLIVALLLTLFLRPGPITASRLMFQSAVESSPVPELPPPPPEPPPPAPEEPAPQPPAPSDEALPWPLDESMLTEVPLEQPPAPAPAPEVPPEEAPQQPAAPAGEVPAPGATAIFPLIDEPAPLPRPTPRQERETTPRQMPAQPDISQSVINWTKFWDTVVMWAAYPWLCCGILLLLGVPVGMLYLEIKGRRRPKKLPELPRRRSSSGDSNLTE